MAHEVTYADVERAFESRDPQLGALIVRLLAQPDPPEDRPEGGSEEERIALPEGTWTLARVREALAPSRLAELTPTERKNARRQAFEGALAAPYPVPRLKLGPLLRALHATGTAEDRRTLAYVFTHARLGWGTWGAFKAIYKACEEEHDADLFGVLAARLDRMNQTPTTKEIGRGTFIYMRRRAWRYLRGLGRALPEVYVLFCGQVLRHYPPAESFHGSWVANQIWDHASLKGLAQPGWGGGPPKQLKRRAFDDAWKASAAPLLQLLDEAQNEQVCDFAIRSLEQDFAETLRELDVPRLQRLALRPVGRIHRLVVALLKARPELHPSKLQAAGLHDAVLGFLGSEDDEARGYAIEYADQYAKDLEPPTLIALAVSHAHHDLRAFVAKRLDKSKGRTIGLGHLISLLDVHGCAEMAAKKIEAEWKVAELDVDTFKRMYLGGGQRFAQSWYERSKTPIPAAFLTAVLDDPAFSSYQAWSLLQELSKRKAAEIGIEWIKKSLLGEAYGQQVADWLRRGKLQGADADVTWLKGLTMHPHYRDVALQVLGNPKWVAPSRVGLSWLLAMARQPDPTLADFALRHLLEHFSPDDFATKTEPSGRARLWALVGDDNEALRRLAQAYLRIHHPDLGPASSDGRRLGLKPKLTPEDYGLDRVRALLFDDRADVRRLAADVAEVHLADWGDRSLAFEMARSRFREPRTVALRVLLRIGQEEETQPGELPLAWLEPARVFSLAEQPDKPTRQVALTLIQRHYDHLGGAQRMAWLMESADRDVRLFAVRLLWTRHQPRAGRDWQPARTSTPQRDTARFGDTETMRDFLRAVMFSLPPGRQERRDTEDGVLPERALPASITKARLVGVVTTLALEDPAFAEAVRPVLEAFAHSAARGERDACISALARIRATHGIDVRLPEAIAPPLLSRQRSFVTKTGGAS